MRITAREASAEVMQEELHTAAAWLRDLELEWPPRVIKVVAVLHFPAYCTSEDSYGEEVVEEAIVEMEITRYPNGAMHVYGPGVNAPLDQDALREKRP